MNLSIRNHMLSAWGVSTVRLLNNEKIIGVVCERKSALAVAGKAVTFDEVLNPLLIVQRNDSEPVIHGSGRDVKIYCVRSDEPTATHIPHDELWCIGTIYANDKSFTFYTLIENL